MSMSPIELWHAMGFIARGVFLFLVFLSIYSLTVSIERWLRFRKARKESLAFSSDADRLLKSADLAGAVALSKKYPASHLGQVVGAGLLEFSAGAHGAPLPGHGKVAAATRAMERATVKMTEDFKKGLNGLATTATTAPFIGLFGTVVGIINAFRGMAVSGSGGLGAVSAGISEALVTTAVGLFVAIPAVWLYNYFLNKVDRFRVEMANSASELVSFFSLRTARELALAPVGAPAAQARRPATAAVPPQRPAEAVAAASLASPLPARAGAVASAATVDHRAAPAVTRPAVVLDGVKEVTPPGQLGRPVPPSRTDVEPWLGILGTLHRRPPLTDESFTARTRVILHQGRLGPGLARRWVRRSPAPNQRAVLLAGLTVILSAAALMLAVAMLAAQR